MPRSVQDILDEARDLLQDTDPNSERYTDTSLIRGLNTGLLQIRLKRPDAFIGTYDYTTPQYTIGDKNNFVEVPEIFVPPLIEFVVGWAELREDEYTEKGKTATLLARFDRMLMG